MHMATHIPTHMSMHMCTRVPAHRSRHMSSRTGSLDGLDFDDAGSSTAALIPRSRSACRCMDWRHAWPVPSASPKRCPMHGHGPANTPFHRADEGFPMVCGTMPQRLSVHRATHHRANGYLWWHVYTHRTYICLYTHTTVLIPWSRRACRCKYQLQSSMHMAVARADDGLIVHRRYGNLAVRRVDERLRPLAASGSVLPTGEVRVTVIHRRYL